MSNRRHVWIMTLMLLSILPLEANPLYAQDDPESRVLSDRLGVSLGWFGPNFSTSTAVGFGTGVGTVIRLEDDLSVEDDKNAVRLDGFYMFNRKHALNFHFTTFSRDGVTEINRQIEFEDLLFDLGTSVRSDFNSGIYTFVYKYSLFQNNKVDTGLALGLSVYDFELALEGEAELVDDTGAVIDGELFRRTEESTIAPVPTFGIYLGYAINPDLILRYDARFMHVDIGDFEGQVSDVKGTLDWYFHKHLGVGGGVARTSVDVKLLSGDSPFQIDYQYGGFMGYVAIAF